ncbi:restriction endonuclease subunit S [Rhodococcus sp. MS13]|uniref:restriction endonuclease subunit S n=1 Tax=Rhodococcus sp. MS13 TaxID=2579940 RepID=UPI001561E2A6|nr:restriction endonuclease subunit S [Rhodococcus sp. MS13]NRH30201.1 hypothetical protein [Rhodococcus sp. MS13]
MDEWIEKTWGDVLTLQRGYDITKSEQFLDGEVPVVSSGGISSYHSEAMSAGPGVIIGRKGTLGRVHFVDGPFWPHDTTLWVKDFKGNNPKFTYYALKLLTPGDMNVGSASPTLNRNHVHPLGVLWPRESATQDGIAEVLGALDDKIAANERVARLADEFSTAIFTQSASEPGCELASVAQVVMGSSPPGTSYNEVGNGTPFYQGVRDFGLRSPTPRVWTTSPVRLAETGDTLLSVRAPVGTVNLAPSVLCVGRGLAALRSRVGTPSTLFQQVRSATASWVEFNSEGTVFGAINRSQLERVKIPTVDPETQLELEATLTAIGASLAGVVHQSVVLARTRNQLLPLLMSGRMSVASAEREVSDVV